MSLEIPCNSGGLAPALRPSLTRQTSLSSDLLSPGDLVSSSQPQTEGLLGSASSSSTASALSRFPDSPVRQSAARPSPSGGVQVPVPVQLVLVDQPSPITGTSDPTTPRSLSAAKGDFNADGKSDIVTVDAQTGTVSIWLLNGTTYSSAIALPTDTQGWTPSGSGDFNGDGQWDILARNYTTGANEIWLMNGTTRTATVSLTPITDPNWILSDAGDLNGDGQPDLLWHNASTGELSVWLMKGTTLDKSTPLTDASGAVLSNPGINLNASIADFDQDGKPDIVWHNSLTGENTLWVMNGTTVTSRLTLAASNADAQLQQVGYFNSDLRPDLVWRNLATGSTTISLATSSTTTGLSTAATTYQDSAIANSPTSTSSTGILYSANSVGSAIISDLAFSGKEGDTGTFKIRLSQAPTSNVVLTFTTGDYLVVDADGDVRNGTQSTLTFTPQDWNQARTVWFIAEDDNSSADRTQGDTIRYALSDATTLVAKGSGVYNLGTIANTYAPDPTKFNIDLDFRNDYSGYWTASRRAIAQKAASDWASRIMNEWTDLPAASRPITVLNSDGTTSTNTFISKRYVDDLVVFVNTLDPSSSAGGYGGPEYNYGGWITSPDPMPRIGQIEINPTVGDAYLYNAVLHELGHTLGLVGLDWAGYLQEDLTTPQTAVFKGRYAKAANGGQDIPLMSQDGPNSVTNQYDYEHPASSVQSVMSYSGIYTLSAPTEIDFALLADSGYSIQGINA